MFVPRQQYPRELKIAIIARAGLGKEHSGSGACDQVSPNRLMAWRGEWRPKGEQAFGHWARPQAKLGAERIPELERKIGR